MSEWMRAAAGLMAAAAQTVPPGSYWRHHKGGLFYVRGACVREGDLAACVLYSADDDPMQVVLCRPLWEWLETVRHAKAVEVARYTREEGRHG